MPINRDAILFLTLPIIINFKFKYYENNSVYPIQSIILNFFF